MDAESTTAQRALWQYDEPAPGAERFIDEAFDGYRQQARLLLPDSERAPPVFVVGGARSDFTRLNPLLYRLQQQGIGSLTGNLSGHSLASEPGARDASLASNLQEALRFHQHLDSRSDTLIGHSLGGAIALKLAAQRPNVRKLVLICPAVYPDAAHSAPFGPAFTAAIRKPYAFLDCDSYAFLRQFQGRVLLVIGEYDGLNSRVHGQGAGTSAGVRRMAGVERYSPIPEEVTHSLLRSVPAPYVECLMLTDCDHGIAAHLRDRPEVADQVAQAVGAFILG
ncbi:alpha/beta fold hydrolase [Pseudomonas sichuanensis]|uniref:alpha/beta hydrolase n=1 Tax=Pseudomonas sichuanensis TaxID=2213015 RepID=UPI0024468277|nr:alpha/beta hydrolase [Pseudomonas sichuanensis]MDH0730591.1 alpha/beta fold hydrolase [Pseudomonas sichuanensis]MDH1585048.1 alpha/beta fold hydrolase [Pseudomonas sichuanensis]MDH1594042.1 alpha/beta fold hydrolase [Pseudomonas sichuanensis]MDH1600533.1 alpha/beta fold hydrolase [Pseudomonas sichuanensis]